MGIIALPIEHTSIDGEPMGRCTLTVPRPKQQGQWEKADHIPLFFPPSLLPLSLTRGTWIGIRGRLLTYTAYSDSGIREGGWGVYVTHLNWLHNSLG